MDKYIDFNYDSLFYPAYGYVMSECEPAGGGQIWHHTRLVGHGQGWFSGMIFHMKKGGGRKIIVKTLWKSLQCLSNFEFIYIFITKKWNPALSLVDLCRFCSSYHGSVLQHWPWAVSRGGGGVFLTPVTYPLLKRIHPGLDIWTIGKVGKYTKYFTWRSACEKV